MNKKNISISMLCVPLILLVLYNIKNNSNFFDAPIYTILNICVAIFFAYYLTQFKNDERKLKEKAEEIINKLQRDINDNRAYNIKNKQDVEWCLMMHRQVNNRIQILYELHGKLKIENEINYIKDKFKEYRDFMGNHIEDLEFLSKSQMDLLQKLELIDFKLDEIKIGFYKD